MDEQQLAHYQRRYEAAMHAMQTGVATKMGFDQSETSPKHLRVGMNSALQNCDAIAHLLMEKGVITEEEYMIAVVEAAEREAEMYRQEISQHYGGAHIHLR